MTPLKKSESTIPTQEAVYAAAAAAFSAKGFDGVSMDDIARDAGVNKAMIYYHYADKLTLYRSVVSEGLQRMSAAAGEIVAGTATPIDKMDQFIAAFVRMTEARPWMPAIMLREIAEGAPRLDVDTLQHMRGVIAAFAMILKQGQNRGDFRDVHPILAYESVVGPIIINAARERVTAQPGRSPENFPLFASISHTDLIAHSQETARRMLRP
ncbi:MAG TPA: TetR/AcrR family transcriptional regulator [Vicinamibacterales bacterium]|nr:TetR/AcrR family transcriptional regulator [Vicinamibacterales bacterium]